MNCTEQAERAGFDLSLAEENLRCSYEQRVLQHQEALTLALELERIGRELRDGLNLLHRPFDPSPDTALEKTWR
jgi:hypothetical protein